MAKQKFEISFFDGIDLEVSSEDSNQQSALKTRNLNNLRSMGNLTPTQKDRYFTRTGLKETFTNIGIDKDNWILQIATLKTDNDTNLVMISGGQGGHIFGPGSGYADEGYAGGGIDIFYDIYSNDVDDSHLAGEDEAVPDALFDNENNSVDTPEHLKSSFSSSSHTATVQKWNNALHIGVGNTDSDKSKWVGHVKGGFTYENKDDADAIYNTIACKNSALRSPEGFNFTKIVTDCYHDPSYTSTDADKLNKIGKYAYGMIYAGNYVYQYDCDFDSSGEISSFKYTQKSQRLGHIVAMCYDPNFAHSSYSGSALLVVDTGDSTIGDFGGHIVALRTDDLKIVAKYPINYSGSGRGWDDGMTDRELGLVGEDSGKTGHQYAGARGRGIGDIIVTSAMDNDGAKTIWISIWGEHKICGLGNLKMGDQHELGFNDSNGIITNTTLNGTGLEVTGSDGTEDSQAIGVDSIGGHVMHPASFRVLWSYTFDSGANYASNGTSLDFKNSSPPCVGKGYPGYYHYNEDFDSQKRIGYLDGDLNYRWNRSGINRSGMLEGDGWYYIPRNALSYSDISRNWVDMICTLASRPADKLIDYDWTENGTINYNDTKYQLLDSGYERSNEPLKGWEKHNLQSGAEGVSYNNHLRPLWINTVSYNEASFGMNFGTGKLSAGGSGDGAWNENRYPITSAIISTRYNRDLINGNKYFGMGHQASNFIDDYPNQDSQFMTTWKSHAQYAINQDANDNSNDSQTGNSAYWWTHTKDNVNCFAHASNPVDASYNNIANTVRIVPLKRYGATWDEHDVKVAINENQFRDDLCSPDFLSDISRSNEDMKFPFLGWYNYATIDGGTITKKRMIFIKTKGSENGTYVVNINRTADNYITGSKKLPNNQTSRTNNAQSLVASPNNGEYLPFRLYNGALDPYSALESTDTYYRASQFLSHSRTQPEMFAAFTGLNPTTEPTNVTVTQDGFSQYTVMMPQDDSLTIGSDVISIESKFDTESSAANWGDDTISVVYSASFEADGFQDSGLGQILLSETVDSNNSENPIHLTIKIQCFNSKYELYNVRLTGINIFRRVTPIGMSEAATEFTLVKYISFREDFSVKSEENGNYYREFTVKDSNDAGVSYTALTGMSELIENSSLNYKLSTIIGSYHFVANAYVNQTGETVEQTIFRSQPAKFDMFDWSVDFITLPEVPNAIQGFKGRLYAFSDSKMYTIEPNTLQVLDVFEGGGCFGPRAVAISDEYGMLFVSKNNIYLHNGSNTVNISSKILDSHDRKDEAALSNNSFLSLWRNSDSEWGETEFQRFRLPLVNFFPKQDCFIIALGHKRNNNLGLAYTPKTNRWDVWDLSYMQAACLGDRDDLIYVSGTSSTNHNSENVDVSLRQMQSSFDSVQGGDDLPIVEENGAWYSHKITMGQPTIEKIFTKLKLAGNFDFTTDNEGNQIVDFASGPTTLNVYTDKGKLQSSNFTQSQDESSDTLLVWKLSGSVRKARWIRFEIIGISKESHIEALSVTYRPGRIR